MFDRRGSGLSDPVQGAPTLEEQMDDVVAVMDAAGSERAAVFAWLEGGAMAALFAGIPSCSGGNHRVAYTKPQISRVPMMPAIIQPQVQSLRPPEETSATRIIEDGCQT